MFRFQRLVSGGMAFAVGCLVVVPVRGGAQSLDGRIVKPRGGPELPTTPEEAQGEKWRGKPLDPSNGFGAKESPILVVPPSQPVAADHSGSPRPIDRRPFVGDIDPRPAWAAGLLQPDGAVAEPLAVGAVVVW